MANSTIVVIAHLAAANKEARDQVMKELQSCLEHARIHEPGVVKYALCLPDHSQDETNIYIIEEYLDREAYDTHMSSQPVVKFTSLIQSASPALLLPRPTTQIYTVSWISTAYLARATRLPTAHPATEDYDLRSRVEKPYVLFATITDPDQQDIAALEPFGSAIVKYATENEPDTIFYADARPVDITPTDASDNTEAGFICALEVYADKGACLKHLQDESVQNLAVEGHKLGSKFDIVQLNMVQGWLVRD